MPIKESDYILITNRARLDVCERALLACRFAPNSEEAEVKHDTLMKIKKLLNCVYAKIDVSKGE